MVYLGIGYFSVVVVWLFIYFKYASCLKEAIDDYVSDSYSASYSGSYLTLVGFSVIHWLVWPITTWVVIFFLINLKKECNDEE